MHALIYDLVYVGASDGRELFSTPGIIIFYQAVQQGGDMYVDLLTEEIQHLGVGNYPSEQVLIFSSVILQRDQMICKGADIRRLLDRQITQWREGLFDLLIQEADRCDRGLKHFCGPS